MTTIQSRAALMKYLGAKQKNPVWAWCAVNDEERKVYLSIWADTAKKRDGMRLSYLIQEPTWGIEDDGSMHSARKDHDEKLALVFEQGYEPYGYVVEAKDRHSRPRQIEKTQTSFIFSIELERLQDGSIIAYRKSRIEIR